MRSASPPADQVWEEIASQDRSGLSDQALHMGCYHDERRSAQRNRALRAGYLVFNGGRTTISCTVRDISLTGAKIHVVNATSIPARFHLALPGVVRLPCSLVWYSATELGVAFDDYGRAATSPTPGPVSL